MKYKVTRLAKILAKMGLRISKPKTKTIRINTRNADKLELDAEQLVKLRTLLTLAVTSARMADMTGTYR